MEHKIETKNTMEIETVERNGNAHAIRFLAAIEQFDTKSCARCAGLLLSDWCYDLENPGEHHLRVLRCVQCGHRIDPTIVQNRIRLTVAHNREGRFKEEHSMNAEHWEDAAVSG